MTSTTFESYAQNGEDVVLWRALGNIPNGRYVDVGANDPTVDSITRAFYDRGWRGITIEPVPEYAERHRTQRIRDIVVEAAIIDTDVTTVTLHQVDDTGLSTLVDEIGEQHVASGLQRHDIVVAARRLDNVLAEADWGGADIHFATVDVEGAEAAVLNSIDLTVWRPWVLVIEATAPRSTEPTHAVWEDIVLKAGYEFCLFDGLSRFYVAAEHAATLRAQLSYPACAIDDYTTHAYRLLAQDKAELVDRLDELEGTVERLTNELIRWRSAALGSWADAARVPAVSTGAQAELEAMRSTVSWRVTKPLRAVRHAAGTRLRRPSS
jgi:FkbM family methyltransferase